MRYKASFISKMKGRCLRTAYIYLHLVHQVHYDTVLCLLWPHENRNTVKFTTGYNIIRLQLCPQDDSVSDSYGHLNLVRRQDYFLLGGGILTHQQYMYQIGQYHAIPAVLYPITWFTCRFSSACLNERLIVDLLP